jgi:hypothetical protein
MATVKALTLLTLLLCALSAQAVPANRLYKRLVGTLECQPIKNGTLTITSGNLSKYVLADTHETTYNARNVHNNLVMIALPQFTIDYTASLANFVFVACRATDNTNPFMSWPQEHDGVYYGHLSPATLGDRNTSNSQDMGNPPLCATTLHVNDQLGYDVLSAQPCSYSDDSGQFLQYWRYTPAQNGKLEFVGFTAPDGPYPDSNNTVFNFQAGASDANPAITLQRSIGTQSTGWTFRLVSE